MQAHVRVGTEAEIELLARRDEADLGAPDVARRHDQIDRPREQRLRAGVDDPRAQVHPRRAQRNRDERQLDLRREAADRHAMRRTVGAHADARCDEPQPEATVVDARHLARAPPALAGRLVLLLARLDDDGVGLLARAQLVVGELRRLDAERRSLERARQLDVVPVFAGRLPHARGGLPLDRDCGRAHELRAVIRPPRRARHDVRRGEHGSAGGARRSRR